jgi:cytochrome c oxidase subunit 3
MATLATTTRGKHGGRGAGLNGPWGGGDGGRRPGGFRQPDNARLGVLFGLATVGMLFIAMTSAYVMRRGLGGDWGRTPMLAILWVNAAVLLTSSASLEVGRRSLTDLTRAIRWLAVTILLGLLFVGGQLVAWRALRSQGVYLASNPHSAFFYLLSGIHGVHVIGGLGALSYVGVCMRRCGDQTVIVSRRAGAAAMYWHFMAGLWVYLLFLLFGTR